MLIGLAFIVHGAAAMPRKPSAASIFLQEMFSKPLSCAVDLCYNGIVPEFRQNSG